MRTGHILISLAILSINIGYSKSSNDAQPTLQRLPFDEFWMATKFEDSSVPARANTYYFSGGDYLVTANYNYPLTIRCVFDGKQN